MQSPDSSSHIELGGFSSISQSDRQSPPRRSKKSSLSPKYLPQHDEDSHLESQVKPQSLTTWSKVCRKRAINLPILLILCIALIDVPILGAGTSYYMNQDTLKSKMQESMLKPLQSMSENLKTDPIMDIRLIETGLPCPVGYQIIKLGIWPGTMAGCLCENGDLYRTSCAQINSPQCKRELLSSFRINLYEWNGLDWCAKRAVPGTDYLKQAVCPPNHKECYPGGCFLNDCPVTRIVSGPYGILTLEKTQGKLPLINVQLTLGETPCDMREVESYKSWLTKQESCDKYGLNQQAMTRLASQTAYYSYLENSFPYSIMRLPSFVGNITATSSVLSSIARMKTAKLDYCQDIDEKAINNFLEITPNKVNLTCLVLVFVLQLKSVLDITCTLAPSSKTKLFKNSSKLVQTLCILNIIAFVTAIIMLVNFAHVYHILQATIKYFEEYYSLGCFIGGAGDTVIADYVEILKIANDGSWIYLSLLVSKILSGWLCFRLYIVKKRSSKEGKGSNQYLWNFSVKKFFNDFL